MSPRLNKDRKIGYVLVLISSGVLYWLSSSPAYAPPKNLNTQLNLIFALLATVGMIVGLFYAAWGKEEARIDRVTDYWIYSNDADAAADQTPPPPAGIFPERQEPHKDPKIEERVARMMAENEQTRFETVPTESDNPFFTK